MDRHLEQGLGGLAKVDQPFKLHELRCGWQHGPSGAGPPQLSSRPKLDMERIVRATVLADVSVQAIRDEQQPWREGRMCRSH